MDKCRLQDLPPNVISARPAAPNPSATPYLRRSNAERWWARKVTSREDSSTDMVSQEYKLASFYTELKGANSGNQSFLLRNSCWCSWIV